MASLRKQAKLTYKASDAKKIARQLAQQQKKLERQRRKARRRT